MTKKTTQEFAKDILNRFDLTLIGEYTGAKNKVLVRCLCGTEYFIIATNLLSRGNKCPGCISSRTSWTLESEQLLRDMVYSNKTTAEIMQTLNITESAIYSKCSRLGLKRDRFATYGEPAIRKLCEDLGYIIHSLGSGTGAFIKYTCNKGHENTQIISNFQQGYRCSKCSTKESVGCLEVLTFIREHYKGWIIERDRTILEGKELDIVIPDLGIAIEFNGLYRHREEKVGINYHRDKTDGVLDFGYQLIHISDIEWLNKKDIVKSKLLSILGLSTSARVYARLCQVREIGFPKDFLNMYHIQGAGAPSKYNYGLFYKEELVAVMTFGIPRFSNSETWELIRYATKYSVIGGASKLLAYFKQQNTGSIVTYANRSYSTGNLYKILGFVYSHTTQPNYVYFGRHKVLSRYKCQKPRLRDLFPDHYADNLTEKEIMERAGYYPVYDSGNDVWVLPQ